MYVKRGVTASIISKFLPPPCLYIITCQTCFIIRTSNHILWQLTHMFQHWKWPASYCELRENKYLVCACACLVLYMQHTPTAEVTTQIACRRSGTTIESSYSARLNWGNSIRPLELRIKYDGCIHSTPNSRMRNSLICTQIAAWSLNTMQNITLNILFFPPIIIQLTHYKSVSTTYVVEPKILHYI
jgi:hypothetical protein